MAKQLYVQRLTNGTVLRQSNIIFDSIVLSTDIIDYDTDTGIITFNGTGPYTLKWSITTTLPGTRGGPTFVLRANDADFDEHVQYTYINQSSGMAIVTPPEVGYQLSLVNKLSFNVTYDTIVSPKAMLSIDDYVAGGGTPGPQGPQGPQGEVGPAGPEGPAATIPTFTATATAGTPVDVTATQTDDTVALAFTIPNITSSADIADIATDADTATITATINSILAALRTAGILE